MLESGFERLTSEWFWLSRSEQLMFERSRLELSLMVVDCCGRRSGCVGLDSSEVEVGLAVEVGAVADGCWWVRSERLFTVVGCR